jgi:hypothetical protein
MERSDFFSTISLHHLVFGVTSIVEVDIKTIQQFMYNEAPISNIWSNLVVWLNNMKLGDEKLAPLRQHPQQVHHRRRSSSIGIVHIFPGEKPDTSDYDVNSARLSVNMQFFPGSHLECPEEDQEDNSTLAPLERDERDPAFCKLVRRTSMLYPAYKFLSLWLLPPLGPIYDQLQAQIDFLSNKFDGSASFYPHVTIVGSIPCESKEHAKFIFRELTQNLKGTGPVPCRFLPKVESMYNEESVLVWSQACLTVMERSPEYMKLLERTRSVLGMDCGEWMFARPIGQPHISHFYGCSRPPPPDQVRLPPDFVAREAALWITSPGTVQGVKFWKELGRIQL